MENTKHFGLKVLGSFIGLIVASLFICEMIVLTAKTQQDKDSTSLASTVVAFRYF
jgi:hypothetical protein